MKHTLRPGLLSLKELRFKLTNCASVSLIDKIVLKVEECISRYVDMNDMITLNTLTYITVKTIKYLVITNRSMISNPKFLQHDRQCPNGLVPAKITNDRKLSD
ncbi:hypothetical protein LOAG_01513 [Loa loa]|uniref:Uncharacterized protein n=1 Tax=Loa loa TaxID=7209 RepID=A0A1S0U9A4_LOALO|nr:hypothetical protein LOAG_01513 [Loa loa]EFO26978.1 hypothetical protein LOAG_01513 [Loa loa]